MLNRNYRWEDYRDQYRTDWERENPGRRWDDTEHGYRYGWESALSDQYSGREYSDVESDLQRGWSDYSRGSTTTGAGTQVEHAWDNFKDSVRHGWERAKREFRQNT